MAIHPIVWKENEIVMLDQRKLPREERFVHCRRVEDVAEAIRSMVIRGAPAIGVAAAMGLALGARRIEAKDFAAFSRCFEEMAQMLAATRPTAVNLFWAIERMRRVVQEAAAEPIATIQERLEAEALAIYREDIAANERIGGFGEPLVPDGARILTHCNAGALATAGYGTALGMIRSAVARGKKIRVFADETRPFLQGARLTAWELHKEGIPVTLITDDMAGHFMKRGEIDLVVVGADRIAANGDVANKIGTYTLAVLAHEHGIPFYVCAPRSTIDLSLSDGDRIPIEERSPSEVTHLCGQPIAPEGIDVANPAFDVTPNRLVTAVVTEAGIARPPYGETIPALFST